MKEVRDWDEFKPGASEWSPHLSRREFLELAGVTLALAGVTGCTRPPRDPVYPYVQRPEDSIPGRPTFFATARVLAGLATGILVETHLGRPTKIEGNPDHPASRGTAPAWLQASILGPYDPDRAKNVKFKNQMSSWAEFQKTWNQQSMDLEKNQGEGLVLVTELSSSPTLIDQMKRLKVRFPRFQWIQYEPLFRPASLLASQQIFGKELSPLFDFKNADVILSFDCDFLGSPDSPPVYARDYMERRRQFDQGKPINQLFAFESSLSLTGLKANQRTALRPAQIENFLKDLFSRLENSSSSTASKELDSLATLIQKKKGHCLFLAGPHLSPQAHSICHYLNARWGAQAVKYIPSPISSQGNGIQALKTLSQDLSAGKVKALFFMGANPVYSLPPEWKMAELISKAEKSYCLSLFEDETAAACQWSLPLSEDLESWSDSRSYDGSVSLLQPSLNPLYDTRHRHELLEFLITAKEVRSYEIVRAYWQKQFGNSFEKSWVTSLQKGIVENSSLSPGRWTALQKPKLNEASQDSSKLIVIGRPCLKMYDGRFANNSWLQELPEPRTQVTWDNVAFFGASDFQGQQLQNGQILKIKFQNQSLQVPVWILPGIAENTLVLSFGYGRTHSGKIGTGVGFNAHQIFKDSNPDMLEADLEVTNQMATLAVAQTDQKMEGRAPIQTTESLIDSKPKAQASLYSENPLQTPEEDAWAMVIDLDSCIGCSACVVACQSENNIPVVGKKGVLQGREMHWIRIDHYQDSGFQPVPCMHCEKAPCEPVCPVAATVHGNGGLNQMVYNRCVGTRYCSNNCPYKVRRFNFLHFSSYSDLERLQKNPDVSIRPRGVMEKCTYCVQRINEARIRAKVDNRSLKDGDVQTACAQTCPTQAITFGNLKDPKSRVKALKTSSRNYSLLEELGTRPRTTYLAKLSAKELKSHD